MWLKSHLEEWVIMVVTGLNMWRDRGSLSENQDDRGKVEGEGVTWVSSN
jgi:hypothetical protein